MMNISMVVCEKCQGTGRAPGRSARATVICALCKGLGRHEAMERRSVRAGCGKHDLLRDPRCWTCRRFDAQETETRRACEASLNRALKNVEAGGALPFTDATAAGYLVAGVSLAQARSRLAQAKILLDAMELEANGGEPVYVPAPPVLRQVIPVEDVSEYQALAGELASGKAVR